MGESYISRSRYAIAQIGVALPPPLPPWFGLDAEWFPRPPGVRGLAASGPCPDEVSIARVRVLRQRGSTAGGVAR